MIKKFRLLTLLAMSFALVVVPLVAQTVFEFEDITASITYPDELTLEEEDGVVYLFNERLEMVFYPVDADDAVSLLEQNLAFFENAPAFDEANVFPLEDATLPTTLYETEMDGSALILGITETSADFYLAYDIMPLEDSDEVFDLALSVVFSITGDGGAPSGTGTGAGTGAEVTDFSDIDAILAEYGITGDLITIPPAFAPFVNTSAEFVDEDECRAPVPVDEILGETMRCGALYVPENRTVADSNTIEIPVTILFARGGSADASLIYLEGGPGGSGMQSVGDWSISPFRDTYDIIVLDQRGTGYATPSLNCPEVEEGGDEFECRDRLLDEGIDLTGYNSRENAADVADLIRQLGYAENSLYGISYGTRLALTVVRDHPELLTSVIIDAVYPPEVGTGAEEAYIFYNALQTMFADCEADSACGSAFPNLEERFFEAIATLDENPATVFDYNFEEDVEIFGADVLGKLFQAMYSTAIIPALPAAMNAIAEGDYQLGVELIDFGNPDMEFPDEIEFTFEYAAGLDDAEGMYNSVECNEQVALVDVRDYLASFEQAFDAEDLPIAVILNSYNPAFFATCEQWGSGVAPTIEAQPVGGDVPVLAFGGAYDPITPPAWADLAASRLNNARSYTFPYSGHGLSDIDCPVSIALQFLADPNAPIDDSCIAQMQPNFYIGN